MKKQRKKKVKERKGLLTKIKDRKELRKLQRKQRKLNRNNFLNRRDMVLPALKMAKEKKKKGKSKIEPDSDVTEPVIKKEKAPNKKKLLKKKKDANKKQAMEDKYKEIRARQVVRENRAEDKEIKKLEKELGMNRRKSKSIPQAFVKDGLDYLLEFCDKEKRAEFIAAENSNNLHESGSEFEEDLEVVTGIKRTTQSKAKDDDSDSDSDSDDPFGESTDEEDVGELSPKKRKIVEDDDDAEISSKIGKRVHFEDELPGNSKSTLEKVEENAELRKALEEEIFKKIMEQKKVKSSKVKSKKSKIEEGENLKNKSSDAPSVEEEILSKLKHQKEQKAKTVQSELNEEKRKKALLFGEETEKDEEKVADENIGQWEDIYGRMRDKEGNVLPTTKYVPPHLRNEPTNDKSLLRLHKHMKGFLNRLAESNVKSIANGIEALYGTHSRHDTSQTLTTLVTEAVVAPVLTPNRLVAEHVMLVAILHANVGSDVGAHLLQAIAKRFDELLKSDPPMEDKNLDNVALLLAHLYNFNVFGSTLAYDILNRLAATFGPKEIEIIIIIFKTIGAKLRKDNPLALKDLIGRLQVKAGSMKDVANGSRVRYTMDVLLAIKNNNMNKIPNYDTSHTDSLRKLLRTLLRQGNYVSELSISLEDLLKADERGRWWVVGSAWTGTEPKAMPTAETLQQETFSTELLALARKQRMNTDSRRTIFCIVMSAEDYLDAFEKLIHLKLRTQKEREIVTILLDCCLQEKSFNPYYVHLACKFCACDRKFLMAFQFLVWDKLKELSSMGNVQMNNFAKFLSGMFLEPQGLPVSVLKVVQFATVDKPTVRLVRRTMLSMVLVEPVETMLAAFARVAHVDKLRLFREGLRLFLHHFVLRNTAAMPEAEADQLKARVQLADRALSVGDSVTLF